MQINHEDYSNMPSFARVCATAFAGANVLPNRDVMRSCLRYGGRRRLPIEVELVSDSVAATAYRVDGQFGTLVSIDPVTGASSVVDLGDDAE